MEQILSTNANAVNAERICSDDQQYTAPKLTDQKVKRLSDYRHSEIKFTLLRVLHACTEKDCLNHVFGRSSSERPSNDVVATVESTFYDVAHNRIPSNERSENPMEPTVMANVAQRHGPSDHSASVAASALNSPGPLGEIDHTDAGNVTLLHALNNGEIRYVNERKQWMVWHQNRWQLDAGGANIHERILKVATHHKQVAEQLGREAESASSGKQCQELEKAAESARRWSQQCRNKNKIDAMLNLAQRDRNFLIQTSLIDNNPWLLGVSNGVVDLRTGAFRSDSKSEFVLKRCDVPYVPSAKAPRWNRFIDEISSEQGVVVSGKITPKDRPQLASFIQRALGYCLTGRVNEQVMFIAVGRGSNGKNVLLDTFKAIAGDYCETIAPEVLMATRFESNADQANPSLRKLAGARCAISSETKEGQRLDVAVVKRHTGSGSMTARGLHEAPVTFMSTHKLWLMTNHLPRVDHMDEATKGRLNAIPFDMKWNRPGEARPDPSLPNADKTLMDTLATESEGILLWLIAGAVKYYKEGLSPPPEVAQFTNSYIESQDQLARWLGEGWEDCPIDQGCLSSVLFDDYESFCASEGEECQIQSMAILSKKLSDRRVLNKKTHSGKKFGLRRMKDPESPIEGS
jgi:putative DNA primase/helicase